MGYELSAPSAGAYLADRGIVPDAGAVTAATLGGGVSNVVVEARCGGDRYVLKQPLADLDVADDWPADTDRAHNEAAAARTFAEVLAGDGPTTDESRSCNGRATVPAVIDEDDRDHVVVLGAAPESATMWKTELLEGTVDTTVAEIVGRTLGRVHEAVARNGAVRDRFGDETPFVQLRIDPYHRTVATRHPELAEPIEAEIDRILSVDRTLVHGDYSPKNVLVDRSGDAPTVWLIDFEVAHWGDPAFDPAFLLNHLFIKSLYNREQQSRYLDATRAFWDAYDSAVEWDVEDDVVRELGVLMLARVDGKSPVEYVRRESLKDDLRRVGTGTIRDPPANLGGLRSRVREVTDA